MKSEINDRINALEYQAITEGPDSSLLVGILSMYLKPGSSLLEIGMGPGKDLELLAEKYRVTGSDISPAFLEMFSEKHPEIPLLQLHAATLETRLKFDCIYSNKVLHQLTREELKQSFIRQYELLNPGGLFCHSFWYGDKEVTHKGRTFQYYTENSILPCTGGMFKITYKSVYMEMVPDDSMIVIFKKT